MVMRPVAGAQKGFLLVFQCSIELLLSPFPPASASSCSFSAVTLASLFTSEIVIVFCYFQLNFEVYFGMCLVLVLLSVPL